jgi:dCMP deaminase
MGRESGRLVAMVEEGEEESGGAMKICLVCGHPPPCWSAQCAEAASERAKKNEERRKKRHKPMMERPSFEAIYMSLAESMALRSTCSRTNSAGVTMRVGCAIVTPDFRKVIAVGYNGNASGLPNACDSTTPGSCGCLHAECNAVINCDVPRATPKVVLATHLPCVACSKMIINLGGVQKVYYRNDYRIRTALELFDVVRIAHEQLPSQSALAP